MMSKCAKQRLTQHVIGLSLVHDTYQVLRTVRHTVILHTQCTSRIQTATAFLRNIIFDHCRIAEIAKQKSKPTTITTMPQPSDTVNMFLFFDEWSRCIGSSYQKDRLYRFGKFEGCSNQWKDIRIAMRAKMAKTEAEAEALIQTTHYRQNLGSDLSKSPTAGVIWDLKEAPGWD